MKKLIENIKKYPRTYIVTTLVSLVVGAVIFILVYFLKSQSLVDAIDGVTIAAVVLMGVGILAILSRFGAFDTMSYGFSQMFASLFNREANKFNDMVDYKQKKNETRQSGSYFYIPMIFVSLLFFIALIVLEIVKSNLY